MDHVLYNSSCSIPCPHLWSHFLSLFPCFSVTVASSWLVDNHPPLDSGLCTSSIPRPAHVPPDLSIALIPASGQMSPHWEAFLDHPICHLPPALNVIPIPSNSFFSTALITENKTYLVTYSLAVASWGCKLQEDRGLSAVRVSGVQKCQAQSGCPVYICSVPEHPLRLHFILLRPAHSIEKRMWPRIRVTATERLFLTPDLEHSRAQDVRWSESHSVMSDYLWPHGL